MKIALTAREADINSEITSVFSDTNYFIIVDSENPQKYSFVNNPHKKSISGSEIFGAHLIVSQDVQAIVTGRCFPNAFRIFREAGIEVYENVHGTVSENINALVNKQLKKSSDWFINK